MSVVKVTALTKDNHQVAVDVVDLDEASWREFLVRRLVVAEILLPAVTRASAGSVYRTELTMEEVVAKEEGQRNET